MKQRKSNRLPLHDYSSPGQYFITIVTKDRKHYFGLPHNCSSQELHLRVIVEGLWKSLLDEGSHSIHHVLMPNHFHCIIDITDDTHKEIDHSNIKDRRRMLVPKLIGKFKMLTSKAINDYFENIGKGRPFQWQRNYYDRVIRNENELESIYYYIEGNPDNWEVDVLNARNYDPATLKRFLESFRRGNS